MLVMDRVAYFLLQLCLEKQPFLSLLKLNSSYVSCSKVPHTFTSCSSTIVLPFARTVSTANESLFSKQISASIPLCQDVPFDQASILSLDWK